MRCRDPTTCGDNGTCGPGFVPVNHNTPGDDVATCCREDGKADPDTTDGTGTNQKSECRMKADAPAGRCADTVGTAEMPNPCIDANDAASCPDFAPGRGCCEWRSGGKADPTTGGTTTDTTNSHKCGSESDAADLDCCAPNGEAMWCRDGFIPYRTGQSCGSVVFGAAKSCKKADGTDSGSTCDSDDGTGTGSTGTMSCAAEADCVAVTGYKFNAMKNDPNGMFGCRDGQ